MKKPHLIIASLILWMGSLFGFHLSNPNVGTALIYISERNSDPLAQSISKDIIITKNQIRTGNVTLFLTGNLSSDVHLIGDNCEGTFTIIQGADEKGWRRYPICRAIILQNLYENIDLKVIGMENGNIALQWIIYPGGNPNDIAIRIEETDIRSTTSSISIGDLILGKPRAFQGIHEIGVEFVIDEANNTLKFSVGSWNRDKKLIIDPVLLVGSQEHEWAEDIVYSDGFLYIVGTFYDSSAAIEDSITLPPSSGYHPSLFGGKDVIILKVDTGTFNIVGGTYFGGSGFDEGKAIVVTSDAIYITGTTFSSDLPGATNTYRREGDAFVAKFSKDLSTLSWSTYVGGSAKDGANAITISPSNTVYITGFTNSTNFPVTDGSQFQGSTDAFISKIDGGNGTIEAGTLVGGVGGDGGRGIAIGPSSDVYVAAKVWGTVAGTDGTYDPKCGSRYSVLVIKKDSTLNGSSVITCLEGSNDDEPFAIFIGTDGIWVAGVSYSYRFPDYEDICDGGRGDIFISKLDWDLTQLLADICFGGDTLDILYDLLVTSSRVYITGTTYSSDFPISSDAIDPTYNGGKDIFIASFDLTLDTPSLRATYFGGSGDDVAKGITTDNRLLYISGSTTSSDFPIGALHKLVGGQDIFISTSTADLTPIGRDEGFDYSFVSVSANHLILNLTYPAYIGYEIIDLAGKVIMEESLGLYTPGTWKIPIDELGSGSYIIRIRIGDSVKTVKFVVN